MFGKKHIYDISVKQKKTLFGGTKLVPTTGREQKAMKKEILRQDPKAKFRQGDWLDELIFLDEILK